MENLIWHYTSGKHLEAILSSKVLRVSNAEKRMGVKHPVLWLSKNPIWENTATKRVKDEYLNIERQLTKEEQHLNFGLVRFSLIFDNAKFFTWAKYKHLKGTSIELYNSLEKVGIEQGSDPKQWYYSLVNIPLKNCKSYEIWNGEKWSNAVNLADKIY